MKLRCFSLGHEVKSEAWIIRTMIYVFSRAVKRGHRPREPELVSLMANAGIPIPEKLSTGSSSSNLSLVKACA